MSKKKFQKIKKLNYKTNTQKNISLLKNRLISTKINLDNINKIKTNLNNKNKFLMMKRKNLKS